MRVSAQQLDLTGGEGAEQGWGLALGPAVAVAVRLDAGDKTGDTRDDGDGGGDERRPSAGDASGNASDAGDKGGDADQEGALACPLEGLPRPLGGLPGRLVGVGGGVGGLRRSRQRRREVAPRGGGDSRLLYCRRLGSRRHGVNPQDNARGAQQRAGFHGRVVPAAGGHLKK